jgi:hypothetical protein
VVTGLQYGDAGDPVLAFDRASGVMYFVGTSERNVDGDDGIPLWKSIDNGSSFARCPTIRTDILGTDYPWIAVDDWPRDGGEPFHDLYAVIMLGRLGQASGRCNWLTVAHDGNTESTSWSDPVALCPTANGQMPQIVVGRDHVAYVTWTEMDGGNGRSLQLCTVTDRGATHSSPRKIVDLSASPYLLHLLRSDTTTNTDWFSGQRNPALAVNPANDARTNDLYVAFADKGEGSDLADVFLIYSADGGQNWSWPQGVKAPATLIEPGNDANNDQWSPVIAVHPNGNQLFLAWYDRQRDPNNSFIDVYGRWGTIGSNGAVTVTVHGFGSGEPECSSSFGRQ